jgi:hypothetical protein
VAEARELRAIVAVAERLGSELGGTGDDRLPDDGGLADEQPMEPWGPPDIEKARLSARLSRALARIATAAGETEVVQDETTSERAGAALARTELVMRGELMRGNVAALRDQLPDVVFLVVLPGAGMDRALELANRVRALLQEALD